MRVLGSWGYTIPTDGCVPMSVTRILVIDDEPMLGFTLTVILEEAYEVEAVTSAEEAQRRLGEQHFDLVLCDLQMPVMSGMDFHAWLAEARPSMLRRVLFMTGGACSEEAEAFLERPDIERLDKPFDGEGLLRRVADVLSRAEPQCAHSTA